MVGALEAAAREDAPFLTLHVRRDAERVDAKAALAGAWRWGALLRRVGVSRGEPIPILLPTSAELAHALLGTQLIGAVPAPLATPMTFGTLDRYLENLAHVVEDSGARCIITYERVRDAIAETDRLKDLLAHVLTVEDLCDAAPLDPRTPSLDASDLALLQYTSGTTGRPKGVMISHGALTANAASIAQGLGVTGRDVAVSWLPLFHDMGLIGVLFTAVCHPYPTHIMRPESFVMRPHRWLSLMARVGGTISVGPNFAYDLCVRRATKELEGSLESWRIALNGSEPVHDATVQRFCEHFQGSGFRPEAMTPVYGMAEATLAVTFSDIEAPVRTLRLDRASLERGGTVKPSEAPDAYVAVSVGRPVARVSIRVSATEGSILGDRQVGEVQVSGPSLMDGYRGRPEETAKSLRDGWLSTGDLGFTDGGELFIVGRAKEVIIKGGRNIYPYDVERVAAEVPGVIGGAAAFGRSNSETGTEDLVVVVESRAKDTAEREKIGKAVRGELLATLGVQAEEVRLWPVGGIPRTTSGKIRRAACRQRLEEEDSE